MREQVSSLKDSSASLEQDFNRLTVESYNLLYNIRHKFESNPKLTTQLDLRLRFDFASERSQAILELVAMIGDITNILNFELKNCVIRDSQFTELQQTLAEVRDSYEERLRESEAHRKEELSELQGNFERKYQRFKEYQIDIERINQEMQEQNEAIRGQF